MPPIESDLDVSPNAGLPQTSEKPDRHWVRIVQIGTPHGETACGIHVTLREPGFYAAGEWAERYTGRAISVDDHYEGGEDAITCKACLSNIAEEQAARREGYQTDGTII